MHIRGQLAACSGNNGLYEDVSHSSHRDYCGFKYGQMATPTVTSVNPIQASSGEIITISGTGFSIASENHVVFGSVACTVVSSTRISIECMLGSSFAWFKGLYLHVLYSGEAETSGFGINYDLTLNSINPRQGSQMGGTQATITGSGFYHAPFSSSNESCLSSACGVVWNYFSGSSVCPRGWKNEVLIGGSPCVVIDSTNTTLTIITPAEPNTNSSDYDLEVLVVCPDNRNLSSSATLPTAYTYDSALTPALFNVTPTSGTVQGGQIVTISGESFSLSSAENQVFVSLMLAVTVNESIIIFRVAIGPGLGLCIMIIEY